MHRLLSSGNELTLHVMPLTNTSIREGEARRSVGKLLRKKPKKAQRRIPLDKKPRKTATNLLRRLSGKHGAADIVPGTSNQKQTFTPIPRSVSNQDGVSLQTQVGQSSTKIPNTTLPTVTVQMRVPIKASNVHKRLSDFGLSSGVTSSELPVIKTDLKVKSPLAVEIKKVAPPLPPPIKMPYVEEKPPVQKSSTFQELKNMVHRFSQVSTSLTSSTSSNEPAQSTSMISQSTGRRNSAGINISPLARQSLASTLNAPTITMSFNTPPQRPPPPNPSPKNSPTPSRKLSPSRLVQRIWKGATGQVSEQTGKDTGNK